LPGTGPRIGLVWAGNPENTADWRRSIPLSRFTPLGALEDDSDRSFVSPQVHLPEADRSAMAVLGLLDLSAELADFGETAGVIANLDLVVTVDSAVAHLSAALGVPDLDIGLSARRMALADRVGRQPLVSLRPIIPSGPRGRLDGATRSFAREDRGDALTCRRRRSDAFS
jgi:hypothetical protein